MRIFFFTFIIAPSILACSLDGKEGFFPENNLHLEKQKNQSSISFEDYEDVLNRLQSVYGPIVESKGARLVIERSWEDDRVNASAERIGNDWKIIMNGGLARNSRSTIDAFTLVACHELGHHLGGTPTKKNTSSWLTVEGQADYFAALKCLRRLWSFDPNTSIIEKLNPPKKLQQECRLNWDRPNDYALCIRTGMAAHTIGALLASLNRRVLPPKFEKPDKTVVTRTEEKHPSAQCRLDTFFQAALCEVNFEVDLSLDSETLGTCHKVLGHKTGTRPACWFKSLL